MSFRSKLGASDGAVCRNAIDVLSVGHLATDSWWPIIVVIIFCTGIINALNVMDGINGIADGYSLAVLAPLIVVNHYAPFIEESLLWVAALSVLVFCFFNFRTRAKCFAGDVGAVGIAFILIFALGRLVIQTSNLWYIVFMAVYGVDVVLTILHRIMLKEPLGEAHRKHAYQIMANELHIPHVVVSMIYMVLQLLVSAGAIWLPINKWLYLAVVLVVLSRLPAVYEKVLPLHREYWSSKLITKMIIDDNYSTALRIRQKQVPRLRNELNLHESFGCEGTRLLNALEINNFCDHRHTNIRDLRFATRRIDVCFTINRAEIRSFSLSTGNYGIQYRRQWHTLEVLNHRDF